MWEEEPGESARNSGQQALSIQCGGRNDRETLPWRKQTESCPLTCTHGTMQVSMHMHVCMQVLTHAQAH